MNNRGVFFFNKKFIINELNSALIFNDHQLSVKHFDNFISAEKVQIYLKNSNNKYPLPKSFMKFD